MLSEEFLQMLLRFGLSFFVTFVLVHFLYYPKSKRRDFYLSFMVISVAIFFLLFFMFFALEGMKTKKSMGIGIGLFGIFSIMRYRTETMPVREMTYLFVIIALSVINAIASNIDPIELTFANATIILITWICEVSLKVSKTKLIKYDRIELIKSNRRDELKADLEERTGLEILKFEVGDIDFLKDMATIKIYYKDEKKMVNQD